MFLNAYKRLAGTGCTTLDILVVRGVSVVEAAGRPRQHGCNINANTLVRLYINSKRKRGKKGEKENKKSKIQNRLEPLQNLVCSDVA